MGNGSLNFCFQNLGLGLIEQEINCIQTNDNRVILEFQFSFHPRKGLSQSGKVLLIYFHAVTWVPFLLGPLSPNESGQGDPDHLVANGITTLGLVIVFFLHLGPRLDCETLQSL